MVMDMKVSVSSFKNQVVPRLKDFGGLHFYLKSILFFVIHCLAEGYAHYYADYNPFIMFFIGYWSPIVGTTIGHEGHHGSASPNPLVNALFRWGYNINGESTLHWTQYHLGIIYTVPIFLNLTISIESREMHR